MNLIGFEWNRNVLPPIFFVLFVCMVEMSIRFSTFRFELKRTSPQNFSSIKEVGMRGREG